MKHSVPLLDKNYNTSTMSNVTRALTRRTADRNAVMMVMGASRGIGFALVKKLLSSTEGRVVAAWRNTPAPQGFKGVGPWLNRF